MGCRIDVARLSVVLAVMAARWLRQYLLPVYLSLLGSVMTLFRKRSLFGESLCFEKWLTGSCLRNKPTVGL